MITRCTALICAISASLLLTTSAHQKQVAPQIEVCFVLDTTGSMSGLIEGAKQKIWSIANEMATAKPTPHIKFGLVAYRDRGDEYVTKTHKLTDDLDEIYSKLKTFSADGGGDTPESVNEALDEAISQMEWSQSRDVLKIVFLVGDAPPHMDYQGGPDYHKLCERAVKKDILINTIQCGTISETTPVWKEIARLAEGKYLAIEQSGGMIAVSTPFDGDINRINRELGKTIVAYGDTRKRASVLAKQEMSESAAPAAAADRLSLNAKNRIVVQGGGDLIDAINQGDMTIETATASKLSDEYKDLSTSELKKVVEGKSEARALLQKELRQLDEKRTAYIREESKKSGSSQSFDSNVSSTIKEQAKKKGIKY